MYYNIFANTTTLNNNFDNNKNGTTVLFLHGWGGNTGSFFFVQNYFKDYFNTVNLDLLGFGDSSEPSCAYDTYLYALSVYEFLHSKNIKNVIIIGHSFGGKLAILLSTLFDINVQKIVLVNSAGIKSRRGLQYYFKVYTYKFFKYLVRKKLVRKNVLKKFGSSEYKKLSKTMQQTFINVVNQNFNHLLKDIKCKVVIVWGKQDKVTPMYMAKKLNKGIPNSKLVVFENSGHFSYLDYPNRFITYVQNFIYSGM